MRNLLRFFTKNSFIFLFLFLEFIAFWMLVANNRYQNSKVLNSSNYLVGNLYSTVNSVNDYFHLKAQNKDLAQQNAQLQSSSITSFVKVFGTNVTINDTVHRQKFVYTSAKVINNTVNKRENYLTLDKGALNGIEAGMSVISPNGVVGIVKNVSENFSSVMSVLHQKFKLSAKIKKSGYYGSLQWDGSNYRQAQLKDIPSHVKMDIGDTVVTSGFSLLFPEQVKVGLIKDFDLKEGSNFYDIDIEFIEDYKNLHHVFVVRSLLKEELEDLENESEVLE